MFEALLTWWQELIDDMTLALDREAQRLDKRREQTDSNAQGDRNVGHMDCGLQVVRQEGCIRMTTPRELL